MYFLKSMRNALVIAIMFAGAGWYGGWDYQEKVIRHFWDNGKRGYCPTLDLDGNRYWYACIDASVQMELQTRQAQRDAETDTILSSMSQNQPKKAKVRK